MTASICRALSLVLALGVGGSGLACKAKPSEKACREAIDNIRRISNQGRDDVGVDPVAAVRSCRGNSSKAAVECWRKAKTEEDLAKCEGQAQKNSGSDKAKDSDTANGSDTAKESGGAPENSEKAP